MAVDIETLSAPMIAVLGDFFREFIEVTEEAAEELERVAKKITRYWIAAQAGEENAERILAHAEALAVLIAAEYVIEGKQASRTKAKDVTRLIAKVGLELLKKLT